VNVACRFGSKPRKIASSGCCLPGRASAAHAQVLVEQCDQQHALSDVAHHLSSGTQLGALIMMTEVYNSVGLQSSMCSRRRDELIARQISPTTKSYPNAGVNTSSTAASAGVICKPWRATL
jgi:hypothetical protein